MPLFPGHPPFQVLTYRSPRGIAISGEQPWGPGNEIGLGYMSEMILGSAHSGAHVDALAHMTLGPTGAWHGGCADLHLSDFGPTIGDGREDRLGDPRLQPRHARPPQRLKPSRMLERSSTHQPPETAARHPRSGRFTARRLSGEVTSGCVCEVHDEGARPVDGEVYDFGRHFFGPWIAAVRVTERVADRL
jgi:hypothetical protein